MRFQAVNKAQPTSGKLLYRRKDYAFTFVPEGHIPLGGGATLSVRTLQIEVDSNSNNLLYTWGFLPHTSWKRSNIPNPQREMGGVKVVSDSTLESGVSYKVGADDEWKTIFNEDTNWLCLYRGRSLENHRTLEIATNVVIGLLGDMLASLWLNPVFED